MAFDERTIKSWQHKAGAHCEQVHTRLVTEQTMDLQQVQADEVRVKMQKRLVVWMAMALCVPTRLWLGGVVSPTRDKRMIRLLAQRVKACARFGPILLLTDGLNSYVDAWQKAFRTPQHTGKPGRPVLLSWPGVVIGQRVKQYQKGRVVGSDQRLIQGTLPQLLTLLPAEQKINTAYIERLNATFRARLCCLARRGRALARQPQTVSCGMYLVGCLSNFCTPHASLCQQTPRTPAMAAGLTGYIWSVGELLSYRIAPPPFVPPKKRGRPSKVETTKKQGGNSLVTV